MASLITTAKAQKRIAANVRAQRLQIDLTQEGLARRSGVPLPTLRKFEQKGSISLDIIPQAPNGTWRAGRYPECYEKQGSGFFVN